MLMEWPHMERYILPSRLAGAEFLGVLCRSRQLLAACKGWLWSFYWLGLDLWYQTMAEGWTPKSFWYFVAKWIHVPYLGAHMLRPDQECDMIWHDITAWHYGMYMAARNVYLRMMVHCVLSARPSAFAVLFATVCSSWVTLNQYTSCRSKLLPEGDCGPNGKKYINEANTMMSRTLNQKTTCFFVFSILAIFWCIYRYVR